MNLSAKEVVYRIDVPLQELTEHLLKKACKVTIPDLVYDADLRLDAKLYPKRGYNKISGTLLSQYTIVTGFYKSIELWDKGNYTIIRATVDIDLRRNRFPFRWVNLIKNRVISRVEDEILIFERETLEELARVRCIECLELDRN